MGKANLTDYLAKINLAGDGGSAAKKGVLST
jgi:hypothetical protein